MVETKDKVVTVDSLKAKHDYDENTYLKKNDALDTIGVTATAEELNYCDGVTFNIQTQLNNKQETITGGATTITTSNLIASRVLTSDLNGKVAASPITDAELEYLKGTTSDIQVQLDDKAAIGHNHNDSYLSIDGGTIKGDVEIDGDVNTVGILKVQGRQVFYYDTNAESQVVGTNNATGGTVICAGSDANVVVNGAKLLTANIAPRDSGSYGIGSSDNRYYSVYLRVSPNVDSDERLKRNIVYLDNDVLADFIDKLNVVSYNYNDDADGAEAKIGLIAQNVKRADENISKYFVEENDNGYYSLRPSDFVFPLIAAVQKLTKEVEELKAKLG